MKKQLLNLSLSTALSTTLLTTFLPTTTLQASNATSSDSGIELVVEDKSVSRVTVHSCRSTDSFLHELRTLRNSRFNVSTQFGCFTYNSTTQVLEPTEDKKKMSRVEKSKILALNKLVAGWDEKYKNFVNNFFSMREELLYLSIFQNVNAVYEDRKYSGLRRYPLEDALDNAVSGATGRFLDDLEKNARTITPFLQEDFKAKDIALWKHLLNVTFSKDKQSVDVSTFATLHTVETSAFKAIMAKALVPNTVLEGYISNPSTVAGLPTLENRMFESSMQHEFILASVALSRSLIDPDSFAEEAQRVSAKLLEERQKFLESGIMATRERPFIAAFYIPREMLQDYAIKQAELKLSDSEANEYISSISDSEALALIVKSAKARILKEERDAVRETTGVPELTDQEADDWNWYKARDRESDMEGVVEQAKARLVKEAKAAEAALLLQRTQAREAGEVAFTDQEADTYVKAESADKPEIIERAKARLEKEAEALDKVRNVTRIKLKIKDATDEEIDLYIAAEGDAAKKEVAKNVWKRIVAEKK